MSIEQEFADAFGTLKQRVAEALAEEYETKVGVDDFQLKLEIGTDLIGHILIFEAEGIPVWTRIWTARGIGACIDTMTIVSQQTNQQIYAAIREGVSK